MCQKQQLWFQDYKNCLEAAQIERKITYLEKINKCHVDSLKEDQKEFVKNNKLILKTQQRFKSERHNVEIRNETTLMKLTILL